MLNPRSVVSIIAATSKRLGATLPTGYTTAIGAAEHLQTATAEIGANAAADANAAIIQALRASKPWQSNKAVADLLLVAAAAKNGVAAAGHAAAESDIETAIRDHADAVIDSWNDALTNHADTLAAAAAEFGDWAEDLGAADDTALTHRGQLQRWGDSRTAVNHFDTALSGWKVIIHGLNLPTDRRFTALALGDPRELDLPDGPGLVWQMARRLTEPMRLAHPDEFRDRVTRRQADRAAAVVQAAAEADAEFKRRLPMRIR